MSRTLDAGTSISHYRVISPLGAGGMGEVYMARDETLERSIALKILPPSLLKNEERVRRFIQEAKSASSLNHPHIVTIYEIGHAEPKAGGAAGADGEPVSDEASEPIHFIAMELITGDTLKHRIHHAKDDLKTLLGYLAQAAEGLSKAHAAGIVHRDLKPENVMISKDGYAKILDFGLAKLTEREENPQDLTSAPTETRRQQTKDGVVMGTVGYMAPEQVKGQAVDSRADVFSFGCLLYEAATRKRPFTAETDVETMHKILHDQPAPIDELNPQAPAELRRLVRRCLAKSPDKRIQSVKDLALELAEIVEEYDELSASAASRTSAGSGSAPSLAAMPGKSKALLAGVAAAAILGIAGIAFGLYVLLRAPGADGTAPAASFQSMSLEQLTNTGNIAVASLSPDGRFLAYSTRNKPGYGLWVKQIATGSDVVIVPSLENPVRGVTFSPDGNYVYFVERETGARGYSTLFKVASLGGEPAKILRDVDSQVTFSPDGLRIAFLRGIPSEQRVAIVVCSSSGEGEKELASLGSSLLWAGNWPAWSPDGKTIAFLRRMDAGTSGETLGLVDTATGELTAAGEMGFSRLSGLVWLPDGSGLLATASDDAPDSRPQIWLLPYPEGKPGRVSNDLNEYAGIGVAADGKSLVTVRDESHDEIWRAPGGDASRASPWDAGAKRDERIFEVMGLGAGAVLYTAYARGEGIRLWRAEAGAGPRKRVTAESIYSSFFNRAKSSGTIVFERKTDNGHHIWAMGSDGTGLRQVTNGDGERVGQISPDGTWLVYTKDSDRSRWKMRMDGTGVVKLPRQTYFDLEISPDSTRYALYGNPERGETAIIEVFEADASEPFRTFPLPDGENIDWAPDGSAIEYVKHLNGISNLWSQPLEGGDPVQVTHFDHGWFRGYDWSPDGKELYMLRVDTTSDVVMISDFR